MIKNEANINKDTLPIGYGKIWRIPGNGSGLKILHVKKISPNVNINPNGVKTKPGIVFMNTIRLATTLCTMAKIINFLRKIANGFNKF